MTALAEASSRGPLLRRLFLRAPSAPAVDLRGRTYLVTGASPGSIGFETARALAAWGASVAISTRSRPEVAAAALCAALPPGSGAVAAQALDLCNAESVERFAAWYTQLQGGRLDGLINNAGVHLDLLSQWKTAPLTADGHEIHWRTNFLGTLHLTHRLLPLLKTTARSVGEARVINVVSMLHAKGRNADLFSAPAKYNSWGAYGNSKLALVHATFELQRRYAAEAVQAYCLHPGAVLTHIADKGLAGSGWIERVRVAMRPVEAFFLLTPEEGAQTSLHCATAPGLAGGRYFTQCRPAAASRDSADAAVAARLWDETATWVAGLPANRL